jgi:hypothetical protein
MYTKYLKYFNVVLNVIINVDDKCDCLHKNSKLICMKYLVVGQGHVASLNEVPPGLILNYS